MAIHFTAIERASKLREANPSRYGVFRSRPGTPGYVGGWRLAIRDATEQYYQETGKMPSQATIKRRENGTLAHQLRIDPNQDALYRGYKMQLLLQNNRWQSLSLCWSSGIGFFWVSWFKNF